MPYGKTFSDYQGNGGEIRPLQIIGEDCAAGKKTGKQVHKQNPKSPVSLGEAQETVLT